MARSKANGSAQAQKPSQLTFLTKASDKRQTRMVSVRIDEGLLSEFQTAASRAISAGYALNMTDVVTNAIQMAVAEVAGLDLKDQELPLEQPTKTA